MQDSNGSYNATITGTPAKDAADPFQHFEVIHEPCYLLSVRVIRGRGITKGSFGDYLDVPDPYVVVHVPGSPEAKKRTKCINNTKDPEWNELLKFYTEARPDPGSIVAKITLVDANYTVDGNLGCVEYDISNVPEDKILSKTFHFSSAGEVDVEFTLGKITKSDIRYSLSLCDDEKRFRRERKERVYHSMKKELGSSGPETWRQTPTVAILGSGGGFRAMVGLSGAVKALRDSGILDCATYVGGLSGSSWYISTLYAHNDFPLNGVDPVNQDIRSNIDSSPFWLLHPSMFVKCQKRMRQKRRQGQPVTFADFFGMLIGETLLGPEKMDHRKLSDMQLKIKDASVPMPILTCLHVRSNVSAMSFHEWIEFTPYEIGAAKYGSFLKTEHFGSKFFKGVIVKKFDESPLHFLQGIWGSAFSILFKRVVDPSTPPTEDEREHLSAELDDIESSEEDSEEEIESDNEESEDTGIDEEKSTSWFSWGKSNADSDTNEVEQSDSKTWISQLLTSCGLMKNRGIRAGRILNFMRGLSLKNIIPFSPFSSSQPIAEEDEFNMISDPMESSKKQVHLVDAGLTFNTPYPPVLRPQRAVDLIISFDFSARKADDSFPFKEILLAEKWARIHNAPFPKIDPGVYDPKEGVKECYVFRDEENERAPIIVHFPLVNRSFRRFSAPGIPRTPDDKSGDFPVFDDPESPYSTFNFQYPNKSFDNLHKLMEFNTLLNIETIKTEIIHAIKLRKDSKVRAVLTRDDIKASRHLTAIGRERLERELGEENSVTLD